MVSPATRILRLAHAEDSTPGYRHLQPDPLQVLFNFHYGPAGALGILATGTSERGGDNEGQYCALLFQRAVAAEHRLTSDSSCLEARHGTTLG